MRMSLVDCGFFGPLGLSVQQRLDAAYKRFKDFCRIRKIQCSQLPFTEKMVARSATIPVPISVIEWVDPCPRWGLIFLTNGIIL